MSLTDEDILRMDKVTVQTAARYLHKSDEFVRDGIINKELPIGTAFKINGSSKWDFDIRPQALVYYNRHGTAQGASFDISALARAVANEVVSILTEKECAR